MGDGNVTLLLVLSFIKSSIHLQPFLRFRTADQIHDNLVGLSFCRQFRHNALKRHFMAMSIWVRNQFTGPYASFWHPVMSLSRTRLNCPSGLTGAHDTKPVKNTLEFPDLLNRDDNAH